MVKARVAALLSATKNQALRAKEERKERNAQLKILKREAKEAEKIRLEEEKAKTQIASARAAGVRAAQPLTKRVSKLGESIAGSKLFKEGPTVTRVGGKKDDPLKKTSQKGRPDLDSPFLKQEESRGDMGGWV